MRNPRVEDIKSWMDEQVTDKKFRKAYEIERAKVKLMQKIAVMRDDLRLNQKELANRLGVSQQFISQLESGEGKNLTIETLTKIAEALGQRVIISFRKAVKNGSSLEIA